MASTILSSSASSKPAEWRYFRPSLGLEEWADHFDSGDELELDPIPMSVVDVADLEGQPMLWETHQWREALREFVFYARSSPEEIRAATRGTERDGAMLLEAGFLADAMDPAPVDQIEASALELDLIDNAAAALHAAATDFVRSQKEPKALANAIPQLFRAIELLLKGKLRSLEGSDSCLRFNNPTVLKRLREAGVVLSEAEAASIAAMRKLRNELQHGSSRFNYRTARNTARRAIVFLDRFALEELGLWLSDVIEPDDWWRLLRIKELQATAAVVAAQRMDRAMQEADAETTECGRCGKTTMLRPHPRTGASCVYCGYVAVYREDE